MSTFKKHFIESLGVGSFQKEFDEDKHPRDTNGRFSSGSSDSSSNREDPGQAGERALKEDVKVFGHVFDVLDNRFNVSEETKQEVANVVAGSKDKTVSSIFSTLTDKLLDGDERDVEAVKEMGKAAVLISRKLGTYSKESHSEVKDLIKELSE